MLTKKEYNLMNMEEFVIKLPAISKKSKLENKTTLLSDFFLSCLPLRAETPKYPRPNIKMNKEKILIGSFSTIRRKKTTTGYNAERILNTILSFFAIDYLFCQRFQYVYNILYSSYTLKHLRINLTV